MLMLCSYHVAVRTDGILNCSYGIVAIQRRRFQLAVENAEQGWTGRLKRRQGHSTLKVTHDRAGADRRKRSAKMTAARLQWTQSFITAG